MKNGAERGEAAWEPRRPWDGLGRDGAVRGVRWRGEACFGDVQRRAARGDLLRHGVEEGGVQEGPVVGVPDAHVGVAGECPN